MITEDENNKAHKAAQAISGFWGAAGAGSIFFARKTKRFLLAFRSKDCKEPHTWAVWGGAIDIGETPEQAVMREKWEEAGYEGDVILLLIYIFTAPGFTYHNFVSIIDDEFEPTLNWENETSGWFALDEFPEPLHFGLQAVLNDPEALAKLEALVE
jgi:8-oxo-dGTP pyrophosphatase MutT (NUDIX family)